MFAIGKKRGSLKAALLVLMISALLLTACSSGNGNGNGVDLSGKTGTAETATDLNKTDGTQKEESGTQNSGQPAATDNKKEEPVPDTENATPTPSPAPTPIAEPTATAYNYDLTKESIYKYKHTEFSYERDFIFYDANIRYLDETELYGMSPFECKLARNEIFARHGRKFSTAEIANYFNTKRWYAASIEPEDFDESCFNDFERKNIAMIKKYEDDGKAERYQYLDRSFDLALFEEWSPFFDNMISLKYYASDFGVFTINYEEYEEFYGKLLSRTNYSFYFEEDGNLAGTLRDENGNYAGSYQIIYDEEYDHFSIEYNVMGWYGEILEAEWAWGHVG